MPVQWIDKLNESNSRIHKETVISQALTAYKIGDETAGIFLRGAVYANDSFMIFNTTQVIELPEGITGKKNDWDRLFSLLGELNKRLLWSNAAKAAINHVSTMFDSDQWNKFARNVILKDLRVGASVKTFNKILNGTEFETPSFECQLAQDSKKHKKKLIGHKILQQKLDGIRVIAIIKPSYVALYSRNGKLLKNFTLVEEQLLNVRYALAAAVGLTTNGLLRQSVVLDGEIMGEDFQTLMKQAQRKTDVNTDVCVYNVFDILTLDEFESGISQKPQYERLQQLTAANALITANDRVHMKNIHIIDEKESVMVDLSTAEGHTIMNEFADECLGNGFEGIMIKDRDAVYQCKRSASWLKLKPVITVDLAIVAVEEGTGRNKGRMGAIVCEGIDDDRDIRVNVGSGFKDSDRDNLWDDRDNLIGRIVEIQADVVTQNRDGGYSLRFPRFERFRGVEPGEKI